MEIQLAECYQTLVTGRTLFVELPPAQIQQGGVDCDLFAIANAYELTAGNDPSDVSFDQGKMRKYLVQCLENVVLNLFHDSRTLLDSKRKTCDINLFCYCSMPECSDDIVQCELCEEWLHMSCEGLKTAPEGEWLCIVCRPPDSERLRNCWGVISDPSTVYNR